VHALKITSETCSRDNKTHMALSESRLEIYLSWEINTCTLLDIERLVLYFYENIFKILDLEIYVGLINNLMLDKVLPKFLKSDLVYVW